MAKQEAKVKKITKKDRIRALKTIFTAPLSLITLVIAVAAAYYLTSPRIEVGAILLIIALFILYLDYKEALKNS